MFSGEKSASASKRSFGMIDRLQEAVEGEFISGFVPEMYIYVSYSLYYSSKVS